MEASLDTIKREHQPQTDVITSYMERQKFSASSNPTTPKRMPLNIP